MHIRILALVSFLFTCGGCTTLVDPTEDAAPTSVDAGADADPIRCIPTELRPLPPSVPACIGPVNAFDAAAYAAFGFGLGTSTATVVMVAPDRIEFTLDDGGTAVAPWVGPDLTTAFAVGEIVTLTPERLNLRIDGPRATAVRVGGLPGLIGEGPLAITRGEATCTHGAGGFCSCGSGGWERTENTMLVGATDTQVDPGETVEVEGWMVTNVSSTDLRILATCGANTAPGESYATFLQML